MLLLPTSVCFADFAIQIGAAIRSEISGTPNLSETLSRRPPLIAANLRAQGPETLPRLLIFVAGFSFSYMTHGPTEEGDERKNVGVGAPLRRRWASRKAQSAYPEGSARGCLFAITSRPCR
jgi:hypothetical protein